MTECYIDTISTRLVAVVDVARIELQFRVDRDRVVAEIDSFVSCARPLPDRRAHSLEVDGAAGEGKVGDSCG